MKKLFLIAAILVFSYTEIVAQCADCNNPEVIGGSFSSKVGFNNTAIGDYSFSGGENSNADGKRSFAFGNNASASGLNSFALGSSSSASDIGSFAFGKSVVSSGTGTFAIGTRVEAKYALAFAIGNAPTQNLLINNQSETMIIGFNSINPTLFISRSPNNASPYDKTGQIGIGNVTAPQAKLHIRADDGEEAAVLIEPNSWGTDAQAHLYLGNLFNGISVYNGAGVIDLSFKSEGNYIFNSSVLQNILQYLSFMVRRVNCC